MRAARIWQILLGLRPMRWLVPLILLVAACTSSTPKVKVLGVTNSSGDSPQTIHVFMQVVNPTQKELRLSRLKYSMNAGSWFKASGEIRLTRALPGDSAAVLDIPIPVDQPLTRSATPIVFRLNGRLYARDHTNMRSWAVKADGTFTSSEGTGRLRAARASN